MCCHNHPDNGSGLAVQVQGKVDLAEMQVALAETVAALVWCSGSGDFAPAGTARAGWKSVAQPAIDMANSILRRLEESAH
jgi:hypothetical protein